MISSSLIYNVVCHIFTLVRTYFLFKCYTWKQKVTYEIHIFSLFRCCEGTYLLLYKLLCIGIKGHINESIQNIYQIHCSVNVNNMLTDWLGTNAGVKQADTLGAIQKCQHFHECANSTLFQTPSPLPSKCTDQHFWLPKYGFHA